MVCAWSRASSFRRLPDAFVNTQLTFGLGYSNSLTTDVPLFTQSGQRIGTVKGDMLFMNGGMDFSYAMRDWIGFDVRFNAVARAGSNTASIFASGISAGSGFGLDWEFRLRQTERSMLSASAGIDRTAITLINVLAFVADPSVGLSRTYTPLLGSATIRYAYAFNDQLGLSAFFTGGAGENPKDDYRSDGFCKLGAAASINLEPRHHVPLGLSFGARTSSYPLTFDRVSNNTWDGLLSFAYMGRQDLTITIDTMYSTSPSSTTTSRSTISASLRGCSTSSDLRILTGKKKAAPYEAAFSLLLRYKKLPALRIL
jgi:hypothetical protein